MQEKIKTISKAANTSLVASVAHLRQMGGKLVNLLLMVHEGDAGAVVAELRRDGFPQRLMGFAPFLPGVIEEPKES